jgi:hypothetical protein
MVGTHENWGNFKCHKWGELLRHSHTELALTPAASAIATLVQCVAS